VVWGSGLRSKRSKSLLIGRLSSMLVLVAVLTAPDARTARAELAGTPAEVRKARELYRLGKAAYAAGRFAEAFAHFEDGFRLSGRPLFLFNMAKARHRDGALVEARALCRRFLELEPQSPHRADVETLLASIEAALPAEPPRDAARPSSPPVTVAAAAAPAPATAGLPLVPLEASPYVAQRPVEGSEPPSPPLYRRWWVWALAGATAAAVTTAIVVSRGDSAPRMGSLGTLGTP
jgi:hypothetical protein